MSESDVLQALAALVIEKLQSSDPGRFTMAVRLSTIGHQLQEALATRVKDFTGEGLGPNVGGHQYGNHLQNQGGVQFAVPGFAGPRDQQELERNVMLLVQPLVQVVTESQRAALAQTESLELKNLLAARESLPETGSNEYRRITTRIDVLLTHLEARHDREPEPFTIPHTSNLVAPDVPRGPGAHEPLREPDEAAGLRADAD